MKIAGSSSSSSVKFNRNSIRLVQNSTRFDSFAALVSADRLNRDRMELFHRVLNFQTLLLFPQKKEPQVIVGAIGIENQAIERGSGMVDGWDSPSPATNNWWHEETQVVVFHFFLLVLES